MLNQKLGKDRMPIVKMIKDKILILPRDIDWNLLKTLNICSRHKNFYEAAKEAGVLPPAFSKQIRKLEQQVGKELFERVNGNAFNRFTPAGFELLKKTLKAEKLFCQEESSFPLEEENKDITIYATHGIAATILPHAVGAYLKDHSGGQINIVTHQIPSVLNPDSLLIRIDFQLPTLKTTEKIKLLELEIGYYASKEYITCKGHPKKLSDLIHHNLLFSFGNRFMENLGSENFPHSPICTSTDVAFSYELCVQGYGILDLPHIHEGARKLVRVLNDELPSRETLFIWCAPKGVRTRFLSAFINTLRKVCRGKEFLKHPL